MKKGALIRKDIDALFKGTRYSVSSFKTVVRHSRSYTINISGMKKGAVCAKKVRTALARLEGVQEVKVDAGKKTALVDMKLGSELEKNEVAAALKRSGRYGVTGFMENKPPVKKPASSVVILGISGMT